MSSVRRNIFVRCSTIEITIEDDKGYIQLRWRQGGRKSGSMSVCYPRQPQRMYFHDEDDLKRHQNMPTCEECMQWDSTRLDVLLEHLLNSV